MTSTGVSSERSAPVRPSGGPGAGAGSPERFPIGRDRISAPASRSCAFPDRSGGSTASTSATGHTARRAVGSIGRHSRFGAFCRGRRGNVAVEIALMAPFLLTLLVGSVEITRYVYLRQVLDVAASGLGDLVTMETRLSESTIADLLAATKRAAAPLDLAHGRVLLTSLHDPDGNGSQIAWQRSSGSMTEVESAVRTGADAPPLQGGLALAPGDNVIVVELIAPFDPTFPGLFMDQGRLRAQSIFVPRRGKLVSIDPD